MAASFLLISQPISYLQGLVKNPHGEAGFGNCCRDIDMICRFMTSYGIAQFHKDSFLLCHPV